MQALLGDLTPHHVRYSKQARVHYWTELGESLRRWITDCSFLWVEGVRFLADKHWDNLPQGWSEVLLALPQKDVQALPAGYTRPDWPQDLQRFVKEGLELALPRTAIEGLAVPTLDAETNRKMTPKKIHEVTRLSSFTGSVIYLNKTDGVQETVPTTQH